MKFFIRSVSVMAVCLLGLATSCDFGDPFDPCPSDYSDHKDVGQMDRSWELVTVNGRALPYTVPITGEKVTKVQLEFDTDFYEGGCESVSNSGGSASAYATIVDGGETKVSHAAARFKRNHKLNTAILVSGDYGVAMRRSSLLGRDMTITSDEIFKLPGALPYFGPNVLLAFKQTLLPYD